MMTTEQIRQSMNGRKIGVVIPCHNYGNYLVRCLRSVFEQTIIPDRIIVVDDSSVDNTKEVCKEFPQVEYVRVEYRHANKTRNHGVSMISECDFLLLFDADNYMMPMYIEKMLETLFENPEAAYAYCDRLLVDEQGVIGKTVSFPEYNEQYFRANNFVDFASLMHKKVYTALGGLVEDEFFSALEDWDFFYAAANLGFYGKHINEPLYYYRIHTNSKSKYLQDHPLEFQAIKRRIMERNYIGVEHCKDIPSVSFVFAAKTEAEAQETIKQLKKQRYRGAMEFCYSTQGTIPEAINLALDKVTHDIIVFIETDVLPHSPDWLRRLLYKLAPGALTFSEEITHTWYNWAGTACYRSDLHNERLDENYPIAEDTEYFERLKRKYGIKLIRSNAVVFHKKEHETQKALDRAYEYGYLHAKLIDEYQYYPLDGYIQRLELQKTIAEKTLEGIKQYQHEHEKH